MFIEFNRSRLDGVKIERWGEKDFTQKNPEKDLHDYNHWICMYDKNVNFHVDSNVFYIKDNLRLILNLCDYFSFYC